MSLEQLAAVDITPKTIAVMLSGAGYSWVAEEHGAVVAFVMADAADTTIFALFVHPDFEGRGLGRLLIDKAERWLFAQGCVEIWLRTSRDQKVRANGFYQRLGWTNHGVQDDGQNHYTKRTSAGVTGMVVEK